MNTLLNDKSLQEIKLPQYTSYYSKKYKYPLLVVETTKANTKKQNVTFKRALIQDPFKKYNGIDLNSQYSVDDYNTMKKYGLSPGHNAPAGHHKSSMENWANTFYHINMTPQEIVLNSGIWMINEQWCYFISKNNNINDLLVLTGSIPNKYGDSKIGNELVINYPNYMYKIIIAKHKNAPGKLLYACFLYPNKAIYPLGQARNIRRYLLSPEKLSSYTGFDVYKLMELVSKKFNFINTNTSKTKKNTKTNNTNFDYLDNYQPIYFKISEHTDKFLNNCYWFGKLIYSQTINELDQNWKTYVELNKKHNYNPTTEYHQEFYDLAKERIVSKN